MIWGLEQLFQQKAWVHGVAVRLGGGFWGEESGHFTQMSKPLLLFINNTIFFTRGDAAAFGPKYIHTARKAP